MNEDLKKNIEKVYDELSRMSHDEFSTELEKCSDGDVFHIILDSGALEIREHGFTEETEVNYAIGSSMIFPAGTCIVEKRTTYHFFMEKITESASSWKGRLTGVYLPCDQQVSPYLIDDESHWSEAA